MVSKLIFQGITTDNHLKEVMSLLAVAAPTRVIISSAFMNRTGFSLLAGTLAPLADVTTVLAGIRNGITSAQGMLAAVESGATVYAVDTGSRNVIFHPKLYFAKGEDEARVILGSANVTVGGLNRNIEASVALTLDLSDEEDAALVADIEAKIDGMIEEYDEHVLLIEDEDAVIELLQSGRLVDESIVAPPSPSGSSANRDLDKVPKMILKTAKVTVPKVEPPPAPPAAVPAAPKDAVVPAAPLSDQLVLVWESNPLTRRYLDIPTGPNTNPTGSMLFAKGNMEGIDQRHYFRDDVFADLDWHFDPAPSKQHLERATAKFRLVIKDVNYGVFELRLTHNSKTDTASYAQGNSMTQLHWAEARPIVAKDDLLGRTMMLYRDESEPQLFVLEID